MKRRIIFGITSALVALGIMLALSTCATEYVDNSTPQAELLSLKVGDLVMEGERIPSPVASDDWVEDDFDLYGAEFKTMAFRYEGDFEDAWFEPVVSRGAKVKWGIANRTVRPTYFYDTRVPATFDERDFIYFEVTSSDNEITNYYRFGTYLSSPVKELSSITLADVEGDMSLVSPDSIWNGELVTPGTLHIIQNKSGAALIEAVPWDARATLRYAVTTGATTEPVFSTNATPAFTDGQFLYVEVKAENSDTNVYCFRVYVGRIARISKLTFQTRNPENQDIDVEALGKGTAKNSWADNSGAGSFASPHKRPDGFGFAIELEEPNGHWEYAYITNKTIPNSQPAWVNPGSTGAVPVFNPNDGEYLAIKVVPPNRIAGNTADYFYKIKIGLLAADFKVQPKSHAYKVNASSVDPLTFQLDKNIPNAQYQWWEANSWYGGYGFDSEGRIGGKGTIIADPSFGANDRGILTPPYSQSDITFYGTDAALETAFASAAEGSIKFNVGGWHVQTLDEKTNVSLHNGGNQYYRLATPGRPIPGATSASYTPPVSNAGVKGNGNNREPFLASFSSQTHYYWVVVTDPATSLKATSKRAFIVTEWDERWDLGEPSGVTVEKEHYIVDLYAYQTPGAYGLQEPPRNTTPFKDGSHRDEYLIPLTFPPGFDIMDYSVMTAQALFYLADGREWIQNWTQGDVGFGGNNVETGEYEQIVLWYNLTNDNATRGLGSSGNEPAGGGITVNPGYLVIKPAGTKNINRMPPFTSTVDILGRPIPLNDGDAQGWFTPYIELCEIRFEGPSRK